MSDRPAVLVTGAAGFAGSHLLDLLDAEVVDALPDDIRGVAQSVRERLLLVLDLLLPLGDQLGRISASASSVRRSCPVPSAFITQMSELPTLSRFDLANAIRVPSGRTATTFERSALRHTVISNTSCGPRR